MTTQQQRQYTVSLHRVLICFLVVIGIWYDNILVERIMFTISTLIWVYSPAIIHFELKLLERVKSW